MLGPAPGAGYVLSYDMVWVPDLALRPDVLGARVGAAAGGPVRRRGGGPRRGGARDAAAEGGAARGAGRGPGSGSLRLAPPESLAGTAGRGDRLRSGTPSWPSGWCIGHWPVLVGYAVLPWLVTLLGDVAHDGACRWRLWWLVPLGSLSASAGLADRRRAGGVRGRSAASRRCGGWRWPCSRRRNAPWLVSGLLHAGRRHDRPRRRGALRAPRRGRRCRPRSPPSASAASGTPRSSRPRVTACCGWLSCWPRARAAAAAGLPGRARPLGRRDAARLVVCWSSAAGWRPCSPGRCRRRWPGWSRTCPAPVCSATARGCWLVRRAGGRPGAGARCGALHGRAAAAAPAARVLAGAGPGAAAAGPAARTRLRRLRTARRSRLPRRRTTEARAAVSAGRTSAPTATWCCCRSAATDSPCGTRGHKVLDPLGRYLPPDYVAGDDLLVSGVRIAGEDPRAGAACRALAPSHARRPGVGGCAALGIGLVVTEPRRGPSPRGRRRARSCRRPGGLRCSELAGVRVPRSCRPGWRRGDGGGVGGVRSRWSASAAS